MRDTAGNHRPQTRTIPVVAAPTGLLLLALISFALATPTVRADETPSGPPSDQVSDRDRQFWSFQKLVRPAVPLVSALSRARTTIDAFILAPLEAQGLMLSPDADRSTLLRRVCLDLVGVPPSPEAAAEFLAD